MSGDRRPLDGAAAGMMVVLCAIWGLQQVAIKIAVADVTPVMQAAIRSIAATALLMLWARRRGTALFARDGTGFAGIAAGVLFAAEFFFIYFGLAHTSASRMVVFVYLAPCLTALGLALLIPGERLVARQWFGVLLAFIGVVTAFGEGFVAARGTTWVGDACGIIGAVLWAATTVLVRATKLATVTASKTLFYQLAVSALLLPIASFAMGEAGVVRVSATAIASLVYQGVIVAFASYLAWFWLLTRYLAARLSVFSFLTPLFGVVFGVLMLGEPLTLSFIAAAITVGIGILLVNTRRA